MALNNEGVTVSINANKLPSGYSKPSITTFSDYEYKQTEKVFAIAKSGVENASEVTTFEAIVTQLATDVGTAISADYDTTLNTVDVYTDLKSVTTNATVGDVLYTTGAVNYKCLVDVYIKTTVI